MVISSVLAAASLHISLLWLLTSFHSRPHLRTYLVDEDDDAELSDEEGAAGEERPTVEGEGCLGTAQHGSSLHGMALSPLGS